MGAWRGGVWPEILKGFALPLTKLQSFVLRTLAVRAYVLLGENARLASVRLRWKGLVRRCNSNGLPTATFGFSQASRMNFSVKCCTPPTGENPAISSIW